MEFITCMLFYNAHFDNLKCCLRRGGSREGLIFYSLIVQSLDLYLDFASGGIIYFR